VVGGSFAVAALSLADTAEGTLAGTVEKISSWHCRKGHQLALPRGTSAGTAGDISWHCRKGHQLALPGTSVGPAGRDISWHCRGHQLALPEGTSAGTAGDISWHCRGRLHIIAHLKESSYLVCASIIAVLWPHLALYFGL
jgi:uncharacterized protein YijF (DUF1287 family)